MERVVCGALPSPRDDDDHIFESLAQSAPIRILPDKVDLRRSEQVARDQGMRGTCAAFAAAVIKEIQEKGKKMSPEFIYSHRSNSPIPGMCGRDVFQILERIGSVPEEYCPYQTTDLDKNSLDPEIYTVAKKYRIASYVRITSIEGLRRALFELGPCYIQLPLYNPKRVEFWRKITSKDTNLGGHALAVVGYNKNGFILQNSWGPEWNGDGCVIFPYGDWDCYIECWSSIDGDNGGPIKKKKKRRFCVF